MRQILAAAAAAAVCRDRQPVFRGSVHRGDAAQAVQPRSARLRRVALQPIRLFRRRLQHRRGDSHVHATDAAARRQRPPLRSTSARLQSHPVSPTSSGAD